MEEGGERIRQKRQQHQMEMRLNKEKNKEEAPPKSSPEMEKDFDTLLVRLPVPHVNAIGLFTDTPFAYPYRSAQHLRPEEEYEEFQGKHDKMAAALTFPSRRAFSLTSVSV
jgi:hypothetical protein